ncbi:MAG: amino acid transporter [Rhodoferax sp.]|nr:amino acid transporter [Rhodoferax sp.]
MNLTTHFPSYLNGLAVSLTLIAAIGAQNAFVLRQGLRREHVGVMVAFCAGVDALLMAAGVFGMAALIAGSPALARLIAWAGALFLAWYGVMALRRALGANSLQAGQGAALTRDQALLQLAGFTLLNPHVYLDTVLLVGSVGAQQAGAAKSFFVGGAASGSVLWFASLGYGARWLAPWFARPRAWQVLDGLIGLFMLGLAAMLLRHDGMP